MPFLVILILFIGVPIVEISVLIRVSSAIGGLSTIAFVIFTAVLGAYLVKQQGLATIAKLQEEANAGRMPAQQMVEGVALLVAGAVLLTPGFVTDAFGFALLIPKLRVAIINWFVKKNIKSPVNYTYSDAGYPKPKPSNDTVIEGEYTSAPDERK